MLFRLALVASVVASTALHAASTPADGKVYYGLFVGVNEYTLSGCDYLFGCDWDAACMMDAYTRGGFCASGNSELVANLAATKSAVRAKFNALAKLAKAGDTVLYYQSSHGDEYDGDKGACLCMTDGMWRDTEFADDLAKFADGVRAVVVLDACYSGGMFKSAGAGAPARNAAARWDFAAGVQRSLGARRAAAADVSAKSAVSTGAAAKGVPEVAWITAADWDEYSWMDERGSEFTHAFLRGWRDGSADADSDGYVSFGELAEYAKREVRDSSVQIDNDDLLRDALAGRGYDVETFRLLSYGKALYGILGECPASVVVPVGIETIAAGAFDADTSDTSSLESVLVPDGVTDIGYYAFASCGSLASASLPAQFRRRLDPSVFEDCPPDLVVEYRVVAETFRVKFGKNGGTGGDDYVTVAMGQPMPSPRTAPKRTGWTFAGYWDSVAMDANGNPKGRQYYDANMKSVRNWDKKSEAKLWAKWTVRVKLGKNGGTGGDDYVTVTYNQPFPKRTMPKRNGYVFVGYFVSSSKMTGQCYNMDGTGTSSMKWSNGGSPTVWALWTQISSCVEFLPPSAAPYASAAPAGIPAGIYSGVLADGSGTFCLLVDEAEGGGVRTAFLYVVSEDGAFAAECSAEEADGVILLTAEGGKLYVFDPVAGTLADGAVCSKDGF